MKRFDNNHNGGARSDAADKAVCGSFPCLARSVGQTIQPRTVWPMLTWAEFRGDSWRAQQFSLYSDAKQ